MIETYRVEIQTPGGEWIKLIRMDSTRGDVCFTNDRTAKVFDLKTLDQALGHYAISPNETVEGATFFELPQNVGANFLLRIYVKDFGGAEKTQMVSKPTDDDFAQSWRLTMRDVVDIRGCEHRFYSELTKE